MKRTITLASALFITGVMFSQTVSNKAQGFIALKAENYKEAEKFLAVAVKDDVKDWQCWLYLGVSQVKQKKSREALENIKKSMDLCPNERMKNEARYQLAVCYMELKDEANAIKLFKDMAINGAPVLYANRMENEPQFAAIKDNPQIIEAKEQMNKNSNPCLYDENSKKLDFFIGKWDVFVQNGSTGYDYKIATDSVIKSPGGCSVIEFFKMVPPSNYYGSSFSFYDDVKKAYRHQWAGSIGDIVNYELEKTENDTLTMVAITTVPDNKSKLRIRKMKMYYNSTEQSVWQFIQNSYDDGKTWETEWDALFRKKE